jgi:hypothetical protein
MKMTQHAKREQCDEVTNFLIATEQKVFRPCGKEISIEVYHAISPFFSGGFSFREIAIRRK